ncbi:cbb3-type cytochrome oxidase assembly protein CcoS [Telmatospirillum sp.]|uniref:cbb3-type cytochrome oxidase assembly protein CcoS n=1 Tax=Telmatospirillum sp. TaxID=2079197 RepID=UPI00283DFC3D|nr:cbb3-type cytochrome oxidase assembly protein CcoS [Telmatospirillum sp.]MDR3435231.1 cbb3-type cytochrome oxidase assembly protein CcoS [Telmatospirillum sp.]
MTNLLMLIPVALVLGALGLVGFLWALRSGQFEDLDGAANRILFDYDELEQKTDDNEKQHP